MISGKILRDAIISGANNINNQRSRVDELNVFPVPDGDTGTNMGMTVGAAVVQRVQLCHGGPHRHAHVGAGVAIGHRENVQLVHTGALVVDVVRAGDDRVAQDLTRNHCPYSLIYSSIRRSRRPPTRSHGQPSGRWPAPPRPCRGGRCCGRRWKGSDRS